MTVDGSPDAIDPTQDIGFEIEATDSSWSFAPEFYPDSFRQSKPKKLNRNGNQCSGENVSIKALKNREFHVSGVVLFSEIPTFHDLLDHHGRVNLLTPLVPNGGMECFVKTGELGEKDGWDPHVREWRFKYSIDLVSTGRDEFGSGINAIVTAINGQNQQSSVVTQDDLTFEGSDAFIGL